ncbi:uncharacterized protein LOC122800845 [Protopterus annectens]|uniref:uncharacterized protein LOC122800845 n=1 Tax=Protopterus annectens TaxID=7888 RepID=UPI001CFAEE50|nr:uncharacterized protein LOC122800845 [Protopterus annectens]
MAYGKIKGIIEDLFLERVIEFDLYQYLNVLAPRLPVLFGIPKTHKSVFNPPFHPIVDIRGSITCACAKFIDSILRPLINQELQICKDSWSFLQNLNEIPFVAGFWFLTIDIKDLYTVIPQDLGIQWVREFMYDKKIDDNIIYLIEILLEIVLNNNFMLFEGKIFLQKSGVAKGSPCGGSFTTVSWRTGRRLFYFRIPDLTWRDVQHLIARTAKIPNPVEPGWRVNGGGHHVHDRYGFGLLDAGMMVQHALKWTQVRQQRKCSEELLLQPGRIVSPGESVTVSLNVNACKATKNVINVLEHVQPVVSISSVCRGDLTVDLISPFGTKSRLLGTRHNDISDTGMKNWTFMSVHFWEEEPEGIWKLKVQDHKNTAYKCYRPETEDTAGVVVYIKLILYGTYDLKKKNMGKETPVLEDSSLQQQIIEKDFIQENTAKVNAGDIPLIQRKKISKVLNSSKMALSYAPEEMDDTDGSNFAAHLKLLWNTVRENVVASWAIYTSRPDVSFTKVQLLDPLIRHYIKEKYLLSSDQSAREHFDAKKDLGAYTDSAKLSAEDLLEILKRDVKKLHMLKEMMDALDKLVHEK